MIKNLEMGRDLLAYPDEQDTITWVLNSREPFSPGVRERHKDRDGSENGWVGFEELHGGRGYESRIEGG